MGEEAGEERATPFRNGVILANRISTLGVAYSQNETESDPTGSTSSEDLCWHVRRHATHAGVMLIYIAPVEEKRNRSAPDQTQHGAVLRHA